MKKSSAFTLIELLVVVAIIAILAGIALPVFSKVMEKGKATKCAANLRQIGIGTLAYANDNSDFIFESAPSTNAWPSLLNPKYVQGWKIFRSAFDKRADSEIAANAPVSYGVNELILGSNSSKFTNPTSLILMAPAVDSAEGDPTFPAVNTGTKSITITRPNPTPFYGTHGGRRQINVLFGDYHVETVHWGKYTSTNDGGAVWNP